MWRVILFLSLVFVMGITGIAFCPDESRTCSGKCDNCLFDGKCNHSGQGKCQDSGGCKSNKTDNPVVKERITNLYGKLPLTFVENKGQFDDKQVRFCARSPKATVYFCQNEVVFHFVEKPKEVKSPRAIETPKSNSAQIEEKRKELVLRVSFPDSNPNVVIEGQEELSGKVNVFKGNDQSKWLKDIPTYKRIIYHNLWDGIDLVYYGMPEYGMKYDLVVHPNADPKEAKFKYAGHDRLSVNSDGELIVDTAFGPIVEKKTYVYQEIEGKRIEVKGECKIDSDSIGWNINEYDKTRDLIIDPGLIYSTFLGGSGYEYGNGVAVDNEGNAIIASQTSSTDFPVSGGAYDVSYNGGDWDCYVIKFSADGSSVIYSTLLGGSQTEWITQVKVDSNGCAYVTGSTFSSDFPTTLGAYDRTLNGDSDIFVTKINPTGEGLSYSTFIGGSTGDAADGIALDSSGNAYLAAATFSSDFPTTAGAFDRSYNGSGDAVVLKINTTGTGLIYSTFIGGNAYERAIRIAVDNSGNAFITGQTSSTNFPTTANAYDTSYNGGDDDTFVAKVNSSGGSLVYSTFIGGSNHEWGDSIAVDEIGNAYVCGDTNSTNFPTTIGAFDTSITGYEGTAVNYEGFVTEINPSGSGLVYSTFMGGSGADFCAAIAVGECHDAFVIGATTSPDFRTTYGAYDRSPNGRYDIFAVRLNSLGTNLIYSTLIGGSDSEDWDFGVALKPTNQLYISGKTCSPDFPTTPGSFDTSYNGSYDAFLVKLDMSGEYFVNAATGDDSWNGLSPIWDGNDGPKKTIQAGIAVARDGDSVCVASGTYSGQGNRDLDFGGKRITVKSESGAHSTIILCDGSQSEPHRAFRFHSSETNESTVDGFTISSGYSTDFGGGIVCEGSSPTIRNCVFVSNSSQYGGAIGCSSSSNPLIKNCLILDNSAQYGGAVYLESESNATIENCTITINNAVEGGAIYSYRSTPQLTNCILWDDMSSEIVNVMGTPILNYCDIDGGWLAGIGNIDVDPLFVSGELHDFYLSATSSGQPAKSLCINAGSDTSTNLGLFKMTTRTDGRPDTGIIDMGYHISYSLKIYSMIRNGSDVTIYWDAADGVSYIIEWSEDMSSWTQVPVGQVGEWTDTDADSYAKKFYRVREE